MGHLLALSYKNYVLLKKDRWRRLWGAVLWPWSLLLVICLLGWEDTRKDKMLAPTSYLRLVYSQSDANVAGVFEPSFYEKYASFINMTGHITPFKTREALDKHLWDSAQ